MKVVYSKQASDTPAFALIAEGWNELVQMGLTPEGRGDSPVRHKTEVLFAVRDDNEIVGVLCFEKVEQFNQFWISLGYVEPTSRKQGVYTALYAELITRAKDEKVSRIVGSVRADNKPMQKVMVKLGRKLVDLIYEDLFDV